MKGELKKLMEIMPKVEINGFKYIPEKMYKEYLIARLEDSKQDTVNDDEIVGIDIAINTVSNS